jgi:hypothetical protein
MNRSSRKSAPRWYYLLPEAAAPIGGGLIKIGQASTWAAVSVGLAPYVIVAALYALFVIGYVPAVICYLCSDHDRQDAVDRLITTSANAIVSLLTLTPADARIGHALCTEQPELRTLKKQERYDTRIRCPGRSPSTCTPASSNTVSRAGGSAALGRRRPDTETAHSSQSATKPRRHNIGGISPGKRSSNSKSGNDWRAG